MSSVTRVLNALRTGPKTNAELSRVALCYTAAISAARKQGAVILKTSDLFRHNTWTYSLVKDPGARTAASGGEEG